MIIFVYLLHASSNNIPAFGWWSLWPYLMSSQMAAVIHPKSWTWDIVASVIKLAST